MVGIMRIVVMSVMVMFYSSLVLGEEKLVVSVMDFEAVGVDKSVSSQLTSAMVSHLVEMNKFKIVDRDQIESVMREQSFQQSGGCSDEACMVEMGQLLGVHQMVFGKIGKLEDEYTLNVKLLDVETGEIKKSKFYMHDGSLGDLFREKTKDVISDLFQDVATTKNSVDKISESVHDQKINKPRFNDTQSENRSNITKRVVQGIIGAVAIGAGTFGYYQERSLQSKLDDYYASENNRDATALGDDLDNCKTLRNVGYIAASVAVVSFSVVTITF